MAGRSWWASQPLGKAVDRGGAGKVLVTDVARTRGERLLNPLSWLLLIPLVVLAPQAASATSGADDLSGGAEETVILEPRPLGASALLTGYGQGAESTGTEPGANLSVHLLTIGRGDAIWERFGHNAIWIRDEDTGREASFNWGMFDFDQADFVPRLVRGTMLYWMAARDTESSLAEARSANRPVWVQELALNPGQKLELLTSLQRTALPENRFYRYDYYRDNCSTRVRDALDRVLGGSLRRASAVDTTRHTYRWHTRRLLRDVPAAYVGIQVVLGPSADQPLTSWEEAFLPIRLMEEVRRVEVPDGRGGTRPLVIQERQLVESTRPPEPQEPPNALIWFLASGLLWGGSILVLSRRGGRLGAMGRLSLAVLAGGWTLLAGVGGTILLSAWLFTDHEFWFRNLNLLQIHPLFLLLAIAFGVFLFRGSFPRWGRFLALVIGVLAGIGLLAGLLPGMGQSNGEVLAFFVPMNLALAIGSQGLFGSRETPGGSMHGGTTDAKSSTGAG